MNKTLKKDYQTVLSIAGSDSGGGAGIQADIKTISALGCYPTVSITALTAQNTLGVQDVLGVSSDFVKRQLESILSDIKTDAIKIGMILNVDIVQSIAHLLGPYRKKIPIILDPVMIATSGDFLINQKAISALIEDLIPICEIITPNVYEANVLAGLKITTLEDMKIAAQKITDLGVKNVLVKGGDLKSEYAIDVFYSSDTNKFEYLKKIMIKTNNTHGTGCSLSSAIAAFRAKGYSIVDSIYLAKEFIHKAIQTGQEYQLGKGKGPIHHFWNHWSNS